MTKGAKKEGRYRGLFLPHSCLVRSLFSLRAALSLTLRPTIDSKDTKKPLVTQATIGTIFAIICEELFFPLHP